MTFDDDMMTLDDIWWHLKTFDDDIWWVTFDDLWWLKFDDLWWLKFDNIWWAAFDDIWWVTFDDIFDDIWWVTFDDIWWHYLGESVISHSASIGLQILIFFQLWWMFFPAHRPISAAFSEIQYSLPSLLDLYLKHLINK